MKKYFLTPIVALLLGCFSFSVTSCDESDIYLSFLEKLLGNLSNSTAANEGVIGCWAYTATDGSEIDTIWYYRDSTFIEHVISVDEKETLDVQIAGSFLYYPEYEQILQINQTGYNYKTKKTFTFGSEGDQHVYQVSKSWLTILLGNQITLTDLDMETGEALDSGTTYTYIGDVEEE